MRAAYPGAQSTGMSQQVMKQITSQWQQGMNTANQTIASNMPKHFDSPVEVDCLHVLKKH